MKTSTYDPSYLQVMSACLEVGSSMTAPLNVAFYMRAAYAHPCDTHLALRGMNYYMYYRL